MKAVWIIAKRELGGYFTSPVAYVFLVIFLLLTGFFTFTAGNFFERGEASLASFFTWHPWLYLLLVPAVGMRLWSEERRAGTLELLLTMPITPWQAIVGKFLASWLFLALALALTFPVVITVNCLGDPDNGVIFAGYLGSFFLAGAYLAISCMTSAMTRNQVVASSSSVVICLFLILAGFTPVTDLLMRWASPAVVDTVAAFSVMTHFEGFQRGVIDTRDLVLLPLGDRLRAVRHRRHHPRPPGRVSFMKKYEHIVYSAGGLIALVLLLVALNFLLALAPVRADLTEGNVYTLSPGTQEGAAQPFRAGEGEALHVAGRGGAGAAARLRAARRGPAARVPPGLRRQPGDRALQPEARLRRGGRGAARRHRAQQLNTGEKFYLGLAVSQLDRKQAIAAISPDRERLLEYDLMRAISRVGAAKRPKIGLMAGLPVMGERFNPMTRQSSEPWVLARS